MQIVIDIDEEVYKKVKENCLPISVCNWCVYAVQIQKGTPLLKVLDKIRAEIEELHLIGYATVDGKREIASRAVMQIIDKYKAESEVKE